MTFWKSQNYRDSKQISGCQRLRWDKELTKNSHKGIFKDDRRSLCFDCGGSYMTVWVCQTSQKGYILLYGNYTLINQAFKNHEDIGSHWEETYTVWKKCHSDGCNKLLSVLPYSIENEGVGRPTGVIKYFMQNTLNLYIRLIRNDCDQ